jgi:hypothetical protein
VIGLRVVAMNEVDVMVDEIVLMVKEERRQSKKARRKSVCYLTYST